MVNKIRGEVPITLDGNKYKLVPSFECLCEIEADTGKGIVALARKVFANDFTLSEITAIITRGLNAAGEPAIFDKVGPMVVGAGVLSDDIQTPVRAFFNHAITGGQIKSAEGNEKAAKRQT
ncbi:gene transfer agent family protein [Kiloniella antarctica]|uniref:Gene transfer agent family protein n=1 Tax=Kiloniella antarctica TaxID=1550907 RepID=A0ABW5BKE9_9PROT